MRQFLSKSTAGGMSAGVVLLWWPLLFSDVDSVTSWLVRGAAWTVLFEVLLVALAPFERALWETTGGERISSRIGAAGSRLHAGSRRRRMGRLSAVASMALALPVALLVAGLAQHAPAPSEAKAAQPVKVVRVTKVVKVVKRAPVQPSTGMPTGAQAAPAAAAPARSPAAAEPERATVEVGRAAPELHRRAPEPKAEVVEVAEPPAGDGTAGGEAPVTPPSSF